MSPERSQDQRHDRYFVKHNIKTIFSIYMLNLKCYMLYLITLFVNVVFEVMKWRHKCLEHADLVLLHSAAVDRCDR